MPMGSARRIRRVIRGDSRKRYTFRAVRVRNASSRSIPVLRRGK